MFGEFARVSTRNNLVCTSRDLSAEYRLRIFTPRGPNSLSPGIQARLTAYLHPILCEIRV